ncbi:M50 family metallopeptidase [Holospora curviuscula]|uniref:M50 family metallopeptidase n=1 Tax=Holospora curviuscula TaxID=1082868 RepID=UPI001A9C8F8B|nr:M50 family metallopeptidase [Holospora curviuscula]
MIVICPLVIFHELGHYWAARWRGVAIDSFSVGFGPALYQWKDKRGTVWKFCPYLLGGYVKFLGDADPSGFTTTDSHSKSSITHKRPWEKIVIAFAGPFANYLLAFGLIVTMVITVGLPDVNQPIIGKVSTASRAKGLLFPKDKILEIQEQKVDSFQDVLKILESTPLQDSLRFSIARDNEVVDVELKAPASPTSREVWRGNVGIVPACTWKKNFYGGYFGNAFEVFIQESKKPLELFKKSNVTQLSGPLGIAQQARDTLEHADFGTVLLLMASISIALGFFNLLPIPLLDGGNILLSMVEWVLGKPLPNRLTQALLWGSILILGAVFLYSSFKDLEKYTIIQSILNYIRH